MNHAIAIPIAERLDRHTVHAMAEGVAAAIAADASVLVIEGIPGRFCLGLDLCEPQLCAKDLQLLADLLRALLLCPRPTLAVLDGPALGGGLGLACACDYVLASDRSTLGLPEALYGLAPAIIRPALLTRLTPQRLRLLLLSCRSRPATQALELGLVDEVVPAAELQSARGRAIRQLRRASNRTVRTCRRWEQEELEHQLRAGVEETASALAEPAVLQALHAFTAEEDLPWMR